MARFVIALIAAAIMAAGATGYIAFSSGIVLIVWERTHDSYIQNGISPDLMESAMLLLLPMVFGSPIIVLMAIYQGFLSASVFLMAAFTIARRLRAGIFGMLAAGAAAGACNMLASIAWWSVHSRKAGPDMWSDKLLPIPIGQKLEAGSIAFATLTVMIAGMMAGAVFAKITLADEPTAASRQDPPSNV